MDKLTRQLREDASAINAEVPAAVNRRIDAELRSTLPEKRAAKLHGRPRILWLAGFMTAAVLVVALGVFQRGTGVDEITVAATPAYTAEPSLPIPLRIEPVVLTRPLQQELLDLQADVEKARQSIERDLRRTF